MKIIKSINNITNNTITLTNMNNTNTKPLSEKAKEGRRRRQRERRRRQREQRKNEDEWDYDDDDDIYDIYDDLCERNKFIVCNDKFRGRDKEFNELSTQMEQIFIERNKHFMSNIKKSCFLVIDVKILDEFIAKTPPTDDLDQFKISGIDLYDGKKLYNKMKDDPEPNYEIFGSNSMGYTCFGIYKSHDKNMYIIVIDGHNDNTPTHYVKIENEDIFG